MKKKKTLKAAYEGATARRYWFIHELIVILPARAIYCLWSKRGGRPHHLGNISFSLSTVVGVGCSTIRFESDDSKRPWNSSKIGEFREGISVKFHFIMLFYCRRNFAQWDELSLRIFVKAGRKFGWKTKVQCCSSTFDDLLMRGRMKEKGQRLKNNNYN